MRRIYAAAVLLALAACTLQQTADLQHYQDQIAGACALAMMVAPLTGPAAPWVIAGCSTEAAVAKLALDPSSLAWLQGIVAGVRR